MKTEVQAMYTIPASEIFIILSDYIFKKRGVRVTEYEENLTFGSGRNELQSISLRTRKTSISEIKAEDAPAETNGERRIEQTL